MQPSPPAQVDWVILQRFVSKEAAVAWLNSKQRQKRLEDIGPMLVGRDDVHIVTDGDTGVLPSPVSAVMSTRVKPGRESAHRAWARRIAAAQSKAPGFQGHRIEAPTKRAGSLAFHRAFRHRSQPSGMACFAGTSKAPAGGERFHGGVPSANCPNRFRPMVPRQGRRIASIDRHSKRHRGLKQQLQIPNFECRTGLASRYRTARSPSSISLEDGKMGRLSSKCRLTTPPDRPRHPISRIARPGGVMHRFFCWFFQNRETGAITIA
jgi:hypothetical protein